MPHSPGLDEGFDNSPRGSDQHGKPNTTEAPTRENDSNHAGSTNPTTMVPDIIVSDTGLPTSNSRDEEDDLATLFESTGDSVYYDAHSVYAGSDNLSHAPMIDTDTDFGIVSDFVSDGGAAEERPTNSSQEMLTTPNTLQFRILLSRIDTRGTARSSRSRLPIQRSTDFALARTPTSSSSWSTAFASYASSFEYSLDGLSQKIRTSDSLRGAMIVRIDRYYEDTIIRHRFLVFRLRRENKPNDIFLRLDRRAAAGVSALSLLLTSGVTPANDCALLAADEQRAIRGRTPPNTRIVQETSLTFPHLRATRPPTLQDLERILRKISRRMKKYRLTSLNCWFFCAICLHRLEELFGGVFDRGDLSHPGLRLSSTANLRASIQSRIFDPRPSNPPQLLRTIRTQDYVTGVAVHPDGSRIVSSHADHKIGLWDASIDGDDESDTDVQTLVAHSGDESCQQFWIGKLFRGHTSLVTSVAFSIDGQYIISGSADDSIQLWDATTDAPIGKPFEGRGKSAVSVAFSPNGRRIASGSRDGIVHLWHATTGTPIGRPLEGHSKEVRSVVFSPDGRWVASGSVDKTIRLWDTETGASIGEPIKLEGHTGEVYAVAFSPDGRCLASGSRDDTIRIWDTKTGAAIGRPLEGHTGTVASVAFSPDGRHIVSGAWDDTIRLWDVATRAAIGEPLKGHTGWVRSVAFFPDGRRLVSGSTDRTIRIWDVSTWA